MTLKEKKYTTTNIWKLEIFPIPKLNKNYHHEWRIFKPGVGIKFYIILNIGFRVCKWTGMPEKRVLSFAFYMGRRAAQTRRKRGRKGGGGLSVLSLKGEYAVSYQHVTFLNQTINFIKKIRFVIWFLRVFLYPRPLVGYHRHAIVVETGR